MREPPPKGLQATALFSERLILEPLRVDHAEEMAALLDDPALHVHIGGKPASLAELRHRYVRQVTGPGPGSRERWLNWIVRRRVGGEAVGTVQATVKHKQATVKYKVEGIVAALAWVIGTDWQGRGYAREAAQAMTRWLELNGVARVEAFIHPGNGASQHVAQAIGLLPTDILVDGEIKWETPRSRPPL